MTTREIGKIVEQLYGHYYSPQTISVITKQLDEKVKEYHSRKITKDYAVVYADSTYISVKRGTVGKEALHILIGITISGEKEILSYELFPTESPENYKDMLEDFKKRGLNRVLLFVTDGLKGIKEKLEEAFPKAKYQTCWTHVIRNILLKVRSKDKAEISEDLNKINGNKSAEDNEGFYKIDVNKNKVNDYKCNSFPYKKTIDSIEKFNDLTNKIVACMESAILWIGTEFSRKGKQTYAKILVPKIVNTGLSDIIIPIEDKEVLDSFIMNKEKVIELSKKYNVVGAHLFSLDKEKNFTAFCRNIAPLVGIDEECATGTSNGALTHYLKEYNIISTKDINSFRQGESMQRASTILSRYKEDGVTIQVGGNAVISFECKLY